MAYKLNPFTSNLDYYESGSTITDASGVTYDNISSGLSSTDVQGAIDELSVLVSGITETQDLSAVLVLGNSAGINDIDLNNNDLLNVDRITDSLGNFGSNGDYLQSNGTAIVWQGIFYTVELIDALTVDFYAPYDLKINTIDNVLNMPIVTIDDDGSAYTLTNTITKGSKITVTVDIASVVNLNITKV